MEIIDKLLIRGVMKKKKEVEAKECIFSKRYPRYIGIDPGTCKTGLSIKSGKIFEIDTIVPTLKKPLERIIYISDVLKEKIKGTPQALIVIEKPFGIQGHARVLLELLGVFKYLLKKDGHEIVEVPQKTLKLFATGKGNADKSEMVLKAYKEFGIDNVGEDGADAFWLSEFASALIDKPLIEYRKRAIDNFLKTIK